MTRCTLARQLLEIAYDEPETFVCQITYIDRKGTVTDRTISPMRYLTSDLVRVYCLGRQEIRSLKVHGILRCQLRLAIDVLAPEKIAMLVDHRNRLRADESTETTA